MAKISVTPTPPTASLPFGGPRFPLKLRQSIRDWCVSRDLASAERQVLRTVGLDPLLNSDVRSMDIRIGPGRYLNELEIGNPESQNHIVLIHGYGAAKGFFYRNLNALASLPNTRLHAIDLLGYGRSSRIARRKLPLKNAMTLEGVEAAESWFGDALEAWRVKRGIKKFKLVAHSLGAYIGVRYAVTRPEAVESIILVSPAGVQFSDTPVVAKWFSYLWEQNRSPFSLIRWAGPLGSKLTSAWTSRRFASLPLEEQVALHRYAYAIFNARGSGEFLLNCFLKPGARARFPLIDRMSGLQCPTLWLYGDRDWMSIKAGEEAVKILQKAGLSARVSEVIDAGHHLYLDNYNAFNEEAIEFLRK